VLRPVGRAHAARTHFVDHYGNAAEGDLPGGFASGEAAADDVDGLHVIDWSRKMRPESTVVI
jgi:hypothetical protein